jgi:hypothetical protein
MPIIPFNLPWWGWLLCFLATWIVCLIASFAGKIAGGKDRSGLSMLVAFASGFSGLGTGAIAVIFFVKWVWNS